MNGRTLEQLVLILYEILGNTQALLWQAFIHHQALSLLQHLPQFCKFSRIFCLALLDHKTSSSEPNLQRMRRNYCLSAFILGQVLDLEHCLLD